MKVNLGPAKGKDSATTLGPWLVTADQPEPHRDDEGFLALDLRVSANRNAIGPDLPINTGWPLEEPGRFLTTQMAWPPERPFSPPARAPEVRPGAVLVPVPWATAGSPPALWASRGAAVPPPLQVGDVVEMTVEGIGTIRNRVVAG